MKTLRGSRRFCPVIKSGALIAAALLLASCASKPPVLSLGPVPGMLSSRVQVQFFNPLLTVLQFLQHLMEQMQGDCSPP